MKPRLKLTAAWVCVLLLALLSHADRFERSGTWGRVFVVAASVLAAFIGWILVFRSAQGQIAAGVCMALTALFISLGLIWLQEIRSQPAVYVLLLLAAVAGGYILLLDSDVQRFREDLRRKSNA